MEAMTLILVMMNTVENLAKGKKGKEFFTDFCFRSFLDKDEYK